MASSLGALPQGPLSASPAPLPALIRSRTAYTGSCEGGTLPTLLLRSPAQAWKQQPATCTLPGLPQPQAAVQLTSCPSSPNTQQLLQALLCAAGLEIQTPGLSPHPEGETLDHFSLNRSTHLPPAKPVCVHPCFFTHILLRYLFTSLFDSSYHYTPGATASSGVNIFF